MFKLKSSALVLSLSVAALLSACGGGGGGGAAPTLSGVAAVGAPIVGGTVSATCADGNVYPLTGTATTSSAGAWNMADVPASAPPCAIRVSGGTANGSAVPDLYSYADALGRVNVTTLTHLVIAYAAGEDPSAWYGGFVSGDSLDTTAALAALAAKGYTDNPLTVNFSANGTGHDALLDNLPQGEDYTALVASAAEGNLEDDLPQAPQEPQQPGSDDTVPGTVNTALVKSYTLTFNKGGGAGCGSLCSFTEGQQVPVTVDSDNSLTVNGKRLTNPFNRKFSGKAHLPEIIWKDGDIEYALSNNQSGDFNEINVGKAKAGGGVPDFIGQLRQPAPAGPGELPDPDGDGAALNNADGLTFTLDDDTHTVTTSQQPIPMRWYRAGSGPSSTYAFDASSTTENIPTLKLTKLPSTGTENFPQPAIGTFSCDEYPELHIYISLNDTAQTLFTTGPNFGSTCRVEIIEATTTTVTGRFSAHLTSNKGTLGQIYTVTDGYFRISPK